MKNIFNTLLMLFVVFFLFSSCEKDLEKHVVSIPNASSQEFKSSANSLVLNFDNKTKEVVTFTFKKPDYGIEIIPSYILQFTTVADTSGVNAWQNAIDVRLLSTDGTSKSFLGVDLNALLVSQLNLEVDKVHKIIVRLKTTVNQNIGTESTIAPLYSKVELNITPFEDIVIYPALLVKGGNSWKTPSERTNGFVLTSSKFNAQYEGYLNLPNADGWGGDGFTLTSSLDGKSYGWGTSATTIALDGGNLWLEPSPAYMKVNVDLDAGTIKYTPIEFFFCGDDNAWSTDATPFVYNGTNKTLEIENISLTEGKSFAFICNKGWDICYKIDSKGKLIFGGAPGWAGNNITIPSTGNYKIVLDMSNGDGSYTYELIKK